MDSPNLVLLSFGAFEKHFLERISEHVTLELGFRMIVRDGHMELDEFFDAGRRQYNGDKIIKKLESIDVPDYKLKVGLFDVDLFIPILTYIFGQAFLGGNTAIVSTYRLKNERYGMMSDDVLLQERTIKELIHELGHVCGLIHCHNPSCVMRASTYVEDIDQKEFHLCGECRKLLP